MLLQQRQHPPDRIPSARYVHSEPSAVIKKKRVRYSTYHQPSQAVIVKETAGWCRGGEWRRVDADQRA